MELGSEEGSSPWTPAIGELVWAKVRSHPWWPARVFDPSFASAKAKKAKRPEHLLIAFFGDETFNWMKPQDLLPFAEHFSEKEHQTSQKLFCTAVSDALEYLDEQVEKGIRVTTEVFDSAFSSDELLNYVRQSARSPLDWGSNVVQAAHMRQELLSVRAGIAKAAGVMDWASLWPEVDVHSEELEKEIGADSSVGGITSHKSIKNKEGKEKKKREKSEGGGKRKLKGLVTNQIMGEGQLEAKKVFPKSLDRKEAVEKNATEEVLSGGDGGRTEESVYEWKDDPSNAGPVESVAGSKRKEPPDTSAKIKSAKKRRIKDENSRPPSLEDEGDDVKPVTCLLALPATKKNIKDAEKQRLSKGDSKVQRSPSTKRKAKELSSRGLKIPDRLPKTSLSESDEPELKKSKPLELKSLAEGQPSEDQQTEIRKTTGKRRRDSSESDELVKRKRPASVVFGGRAELRTKALHDSSSVQQRGGKAEVEKLSPDLDALFATPEAATPQGVLHFTDSMEENPKLEDSAPPKEGSEADDPVVSGHLDEAGEQFGKQEMVMGGESNLLEIARGPPTVMEMESLKALHNKLLDLAKSSRSWEDDEQKTLQMRLKILQFRRAVYAKGASGAATSMTDPVQSKSVKFTLLEDDVSARQLDEGADPMVEEFEGRHDLKKKETESSEEWGEGLEVFAKNQGRGEGVNMTELNSDEEEGDSRIKRRKVKSGEKELIRRDEKGKAKKREKVTSKPEIVNGSFDPKELEVGDARKGSIPVKEKGRSSDSPAANKSQIEHRETTLRLPRTVLKDKENGRDDKAQDRRSDSNKKLGSNMRTGAQGGRSPGTPPPRSVPKMPTPDLRLLQMRFLENVPMPSEAQLRAKFTRFGILQTLRINRSTRFALVTFKNRKDAETAYSEAKKGVMFSTSDVHMRLVEPHQPPPSENRRVSQKERGRIREDDNDREPEEAGMASKFTDSRLGSTGWLQHRSEDPNWKGGGVAGPGGKHGRAASWGGSPPSPTLPIPPVASASSSGTAFGGSLPSWKAPGEVARPSLSGQSQPSSQTYWHSSQAQPTFVEESRYLGRTPLPLPAGFQNRAYPMPQVVPTRSPLPLVNLVPQHSSAPQAQPQYTNPPVLPGGPLGSLLGSALAGSSQGPAGAYGAPSNPAQGGQPEVGDTLMNLLKQVSVLVGQAEGAGTLHPPVHPGP